MRVVAEIDKCIGAGTCVRFAANVFTQDDDTGLVEILIDEPGEEQRTSVESAVRLCPTHALRIEG
jgi:ferredoxin